jgi:hypothetical protein
MKISAIYSHLNGHEWLQVRRPNFWSEIESTISSINVNECRIKKSLEKRMKGKMLFDPAEINRLFKLKLGEYGWSESRISYYVTDDLELTRECQALEEPADQYNKIQKSGRVPILSYNQTDFVKDRVAIEVQFGKYSFIAYDLFVKHMAFYVGNKIDCGIEILPMKTMQSQMSSGPGYYESALNDLVRQGRGSPAVPLVLIGIEE